jgi:hypothetical protein
VFAVLAAIALVVALTSLEAGEAGEPGGLRETLTLLSAGGAIIGAVVSQVLEDFEWFNRLQSATKELVVKAFTLGLPIVAGALLQFVPAEVPAPFNNLWMLGVLAVLMFLGSQVYHVAVNRGRGQGVPMKVE